MKDSFDIDWSKMRRRWVSYFDLPGFSRIVTERRWSEIIDIYSRCLEVFTRRENRFPKIEHAWFSDTFLLYADDDSPPSFTDIEHVSRWFVNDLLRANVPVRGAMSCAEFLGDKSNQIFLGKALVEAHKYGERYNWLGFVVCPSAQARMNEIGLPPDERLNYRKRDAELKRIKELAYETESAVAYLIGASAPEGGQNPFIEILSRMSERVADPNDKRKYSNTIHLLERFGVIMTVT